MTEVVTKLESPFYRALKRRAANGQELTIAEIEDVAEADPAAKAAFETMAERIRSGEDITLGELAQRLRVPVDFAAMLIAAFVHHLVLGYRAADAAEFDTVH